MKINFDSSKLKLNAKKMKVNLDIKPFLIYEKRDLNIDKVKKLKDGIDGFKVSDLTLINGLYLYDNMPVALYIKDHNNCKFIDDVNERNKVHFTNCSTIRKYSFIRRDRYVATSNTTGVYKISKRKNNYEKKLNFCKNCVRQSKITFHNIGDVTYQTVVESEFYQEGYLPVVKYHDWESKMFEYPENWGVISKELRKLKNYICQKCSFDFSHHTRLLDVHHIDGIPGNVEHSNLKVLCKECHSNEPSHGHYKKIIKDELALIKKLKNDI